jgi:CBS domain containing-hemolysin-like protein
MIAALNLGLLFLLTVVSVGLASVEASFYLLKRRRLGHLAVQNPRADLVNRYLEDPPSLLMPIHMGTYTAHVGMTVLIASMLYDLASRWAMLIAFVMMVAYLLVFRLTLPYALVRRNPEKSLMVLLPAFHLYAQALAPLVRALRHRAAVAGSAEDVEDSPASPPAPEVPPPPVQDPDVDRLVASVERFSETLVRDVMTPRPDVVALPATASVGDLRRVMRETKYSRIPVFGENLDDVVGVVSVRDLVEHDSDPVESSFQGLVRPAFLVPETKKITELLREMQARRTTLALVIDEYGGTAGLVTVEDIVEELVGEIKDEYDVETEPIAVEPDGSLLVAGRVNLERLEQALEAPLADTGEVDTVGGLVAALFGRIPKAGELTEHRGFSIEVIDAERRRVNRVRIRRKPAEAEA